MVKETGILVRTLVFKSKRRQSDRGSGVISHLKKIFNMKIPGIDFLKILHFLLVGYAILKNFSYLLGAKFTCKKNSTGDVMTIDQYDSEWYFTLLPTHHMSIIFFPREFLIRFKSIQAKQVDHETSSLARSLRDLIHWSSLRSLLRTYERSTCSKSIPGTIK